MNKFIVILFVIYFVLLSQNYYQIQSISVTLRDEEHHKRHNRNSPNMWNILGQTVQSKNSDSDSEMNEEYDDVLYDKITEQQHKKNNLNCPKCHNHNIRITEEQLTELRIKYVKNQILRKLKLKERPKVSIIGLPKPVAEGITIQLDTDHSAKTGAHDDFYGKTTQKIIFPHIDNDQCREAEGLGSSMCFSIEIPSDIDHRDIDSAQLWVYKEPHIMSMNKHSFIIGEVETWDSKRVVKPFAIQETNVTEEWVKIDIAWQVQNWIEYNNLHHVIDISCNTCENHPTSDLFSLDKGYRPFIVVNTHSNRKLKRQKRNINCSAGVTDCCREKLYISFAEIGWNDWILHPPGYHAYFCRGSCTSAATITLSGSHYNSVLRKVIYQRNNTKNKSLEWIPCCTATQFSSLQLFYMDSNNTATQKTLPNMVVEACGCM